MDYKEKALKFHKENIVIDAHLDLGAIVFERKRKGEKNIIKNHFLNSFKKAGLNFVVGDIYVDDIYIPELALRVALDQIVELTEEIENTDELMLITRKEDLKKSLDEEKIGILLSLEGAEPILKDLNLLTVFYKLGVRGLGLTWSRRNYAADGSYFGNPEEGTIGGLTPFGIEVVKKCEKLGIFLDVSHLNDAGFNDLIKIANKPFLASHSNSREINNIVRNLTNEQMEKIGENKGVIGINSYTSIVSNNKEEQNILKLCDHIEKIIENAGENSIGYGFDLCGLFYDSEEQVDVLKSHEESLLVTEELIKRGHSEETIIRIIGGNFYNFYEKIL
ncbi:MAG: membrane dipeptidase [Bacillota bacterium]|nr:membrane dipeptidase [Bacillota bacterium]